MAIEIHKATPDDALALTKVGHAAFEHDPLQKKSILFEDATPEQREEYWKWRSGRMRARISRAEAHAFKAVDTETGDVVGFSIILEPQDPARRTEAMQIEKDAPTPEIVNTSLFAEQERMLNDARKQCIGDRWDFYYIMAMAVHPDHQRRGVGQLLLKTELELADAAKSDTYLESRPAAVKLYLSQGFEKIGQLSKTEDGQIHPVMLRKARH